MGIKIKLSMMKVLMHMQMRWCMHIEDGDHHDQYDAQINCGCKKASNHDHEHHRPELISKKSRSRSRSKSKSRSESAASSSSSSSSASNIVKVVKWEGGVKRYTGSIKVGEVTMAFPKHMVCRSDSLYIGQKIPSLSDHSLLQPGHTYFLLPSHLFNSALSFVTVASILSSKNKNNNSMISRNRNRNTITTRKLGLGTAPAASCPQPFLVQKSPSGCSRMRVSDEFIIAHLIYNNNDDDDDDDHDHEEQVVVLDDDSCTNNMKNNRKSGLCTTPQLQTAYAQLVPSRPQWKPNLPTITEITSTGKTTTSCRRRKKKKNKQQLQQLNSSSLPLMPPNNIIMTKGHTSRKIKIFKSRSSKSSSPSSSHSPSN